ncbi:MAG: hypothetical protein GXO57_08525 [Thermodesulfobacteria bacterium]|nr:hypothetical protein [Thermodesulfobacteriota bacterium]
MEKLNKSLNEYILENLKVGEMVDDCIDFKFDIKVIGIEGKICKNGSFSVTIEVLGIKIGSFNIDLSKGEWCQKLDVKIEEGKICFYLKDACLYTKGYVDGWLHKKEEWDCKIVCF